MESYKTDDITLELSTLIEEISETDCENVKIPHTGSKSPAVYKQIMRTKFPPNSPNFVKPEKSTNSIDPRIIDTVAGLNIYSRQILTMQEVNRISCYYPKLDILYPPTSDEEKSFPDKDAKDNDVPRSELEHNSETADEPISETAKKSSQEKLTDYPNKEDNSGSVISDARQSFLEEFIGNLSPSASSSENDEPREKKIVEEPYFDGYIESEEGRLMQPLSKEEIRDVKSDEESNVSEEDIHKSPYFSPCCFLKRSDSENGLSEETEYGSTTTENEPENDLPERDIEYEKMPIDNNEEKDHLNGNYDYDKYINESDEEKLLISDGTASDMSNMSNDEEKGSLGEDDMENAKLNTDNEMTSDEKSLKSAGSVEEVTEPNGKQEDPERSTIPDINLSEESKSGSNSTPQDEEKVSLGEEDLEITKLNTDNENGGHVEHENSDLSTKTLDEQKKESYIPSDSQMTPSNSLEDQDDLLSSNNSKKKKKRSLFKKLFSKKDK